MIKVTVKRVEIFFRQLFCTHKSTTTGSVRISSLKENVWRNQIICNDCYKVWRVK